MRVVLDTNQLVRALTRPPQLATFVMAWQAARFDVICSFQLLDEYEHVLKQPKIRALIYPESLRAFRSHLIHNIELFELTSLPRVCRDPDDDKVIATAIQGRADCLLTADPDIHSEDVLELLDASGVRVLTTDTLISELG